jgi:hypothetical protein
MSWLKTHSGLYDYEWYVKSVPWAKRTQAKLMKFLIMLSPHSDTFHHLFALIPRLVQMVA